MGDPTVPVSVAIQRLKDFGIIDWIMIKAIGPRETIYESELRVILAAINKMGAENINEILSCYTNATLNQYVNLTLSRQIRIRNPRDSLSIFSFLRVFSTPLGRLLKDTRIRGGGFSLRYSELDADSPLFGALEILKKPHQRGRDSVKVARMNFDLFLTPSRKPGVILGNVQGGSAHLVKEFTQKNGRLLEYFLKRFTETFPTPEQRRALNPRRHHGYRNLEREYVANSMLERGKLTQMEYDEESPEMKAKVAREMQRIKTAATGAHKSAFKKAGYRSSKRRYWRLK
ncbi:MAG: hypothetical protein Q8P05_03820 [Candidatus Diapherotrites archaeon]|nr:hypothetical protein [Candidatus Diapherotrites archaeon]MDZ4256853.1 hypothetical protein [archaeon]